MEAIPTPVVTPRMAETPPTEAVPRTAVTPHTVATPPPEETPHTEAAPRMAAARLTEDRLTEDIAHMEVIPTVDLILAHSEVLEVQVAVEVP